MEAEDFPVIVPVKDGITFTVSNRALTNLIRKTSFACSTEENRPLFTGCNMEIDNDTLTMAATNSHRLAIKKENISPQQNKLKITIPAKILNDLTQIIDSDTETDITITCTESKVGFSFGDNYVFSGIIKGEYPDYKRAIPQNLQITAHISTNEFLEAIERVSLISRTNEYNIIKMKFNEKSVTISSQNPEIGRAEESVPLELEGGDLDISFNAQYMIDILKIIDSDTIDISMSTNIKPISIKAPNDDSFLYISTPVRTTD